MAGALSQRHRHLSLAAYAETGLRRESKGQASVDKAVRMNRFSPSAYTAVIVTLAFAAVANLIAVLWS